MNTNVVGKPLCRLIIAVAIMMLSLQAMAYDFPYAHQGKVLYYNITSENTVAVTYYKSNNYVSGDVVIPSTVTRNGTTYSVTSIGDYAFRNCSSLTSVTIPTGVTSIGDRAFAYCSGLTSVTIPTGVTSIEDYAFYYCSGLTSVTIPNSVTSIGDYVFSNCSGLASINVASGNTHYSSIDGVLYNYVQDTLILCPEAKTSVTIPNGVTSIGGSAFSDCSGLTSVTIPNSVTSIGDRAFAYCRGLTSVSIPTGVTSIGDRAFAYCSGLTSVTIPTGVTFIGEYAYSRSSGMTSKNVTSGNTHYSSIDGVLYNYVQDTLILCPEVKTSVSIPNSVTSIGGSAFSGCSSLTSVTIPNSVTSIGGSAFFVCSSLTSVTIPNSVTSIGYEAFEGCRGLTTLNFNAINCQDFSSNPFGTALTTVNIGDSVQRIPANFVSGCDVLTSITIPNSVTSIGNSAFEDCSSLTTLNFNAINCQDFNYYYLPFRGTSLTTVNIGDSVQRIPANFVRGCSGLTSVSIPTGVTSIGNGAFNGCSGLTSITIPTGVTFIGNSAFNGCSGLTSVTIPTGVTSIENRAFYNCSGLTSVTIPNSVTSIGESAFSGCSDLTSVSIPTGVTSIGGGAFYGCNNLSSITSLAMTPPAISSNNEFPYPNICTVTVPCGSLEAYTASTCYWSVYFPQRITAGFPFELNASANDSTLGTVVITTGESCAEGVLTAILELCYRFVAWNDGNTTNPRTITLTQDTTLTANFERAVYTQEIHHAICEGTTYTENGFNASEAGTYTQNLQTINGCDSIVTLTLTVNPVESTTLLAAICEGTTYTENGFNVSEAGTYTQNLQTVNGCDSIITLNLTVNPVENTNLTAAICEGTTYTENGFNVSEAGTYTQNLQTVNGCDSIVTLTLTVNPVESTNLTAAICEGTTYTENGFNVSEAGTYTQNLQTINGCDSIVTLNLTVNPTYNITIDASINEGETYEENGFSESEAGTYVHTLQAENGCDSVITLNLTVNSSLNDVVANAVEVSLYPNPANAYTMLKVEDLKEQTPVYLFDIQGRKLKDYVLNAAQQILRIDVSDLPKGVYTIMLGNTTKKLIVE